MRKKEGERVGTIRTCENCATATKSYTSSGGTTRWRRSLWSSLHGGESHKSRGDSLPLLRSLSIILAMETLHCNHWLALFPCFEDIRIQPQFIDNFSALRKILYDLFNYTKKNNHYISFKKIYEKI